jgi:hypothetical protein
MPILTPATAAAVAGSVIVKLGSTLLGKLFKAFTNGQKVTSLADLTRPARVEPLVIIDKPLAEQPYMEDILKMALSTFTGYYLQAVAMVTNVGRIETLKVLDSLNPHRSQGDLGDIKDAVWSKESYAGGLPSLEAFNEPMEQNLIVSMEAGDDKNQVSPSDDSVKKLYEVENLAVGKLVNVELEDGETGQKGKLPVLLRLIPTKVAPDVLTHIFTATAKNSSWKERYHLWRAGQIRLVRDLIFSVDLIDEHRKALVNDTSNVYMTISDRRRNNAMKAAYTDVPSMADASNIAVISKQTAKEIGRALHGKLDSVKVRKQVFDATYLILLIVVDEQWERVTVYHRGLDMPTEMSFREIKASEKGKGPDITEILKAYQLGSTPL